MTRAPTRFDWPSIRAAVNELEGNIAIFEQRCLSAGAHMPGLAIRLRHYADELAEKYPSVANGGLDDD